VNKPMFKTFVISIASVAFAGMLMSPANADDTDYSRIDSEVPVGVRQEQEVALQYPEHQNRAMFDVTFGDDNFSQLQTISTLKSLGNPSKLCEGWTDSSCIAHSKKYSPTDYFMYGNVSLPLCSEESSNACIEGMKVGNAAGMQQGNFIRHLDTTMSTTFRNRLQSDPDIVRITSESSWPASKERKLPAASNPTLWNVPGLPNASGASTYMVHAAISVRVTEKSVFFENVVAQIVPYSEQPFRDGEPAYVYESTEGLKGGQTIGTGVPSNGVGKSIPCVWTELGKCGVATSFAEGSRAELTVRFPKTFGTWFLGRMANANLAIDPVNSLINRLTISGDPVDIPVGRVRFPLLDPALKNESDYAISMAKKFGYSESDLKKVIESDGSLNAKDVRQDMCFGCNGHLFFDLGKLSKVTNADKAFKSKNKWEFRTFRDDSTNSPCFSDRSRVQGIITSNAMLVQPGLPTFSKGQLSYQISGMHYNQDGTEFMGEYTMQMRADDARCLYGYSDAPIQTKVSVTDSAGTQKIATTSVSERGGWLTIRARNFTFSSPKIVVSIKQGKKSKAASTPSISVGKGKSLAAKTLMSKAKIKAKKGDKLDISVVGTTTSGVTDSGKSLKFKSKGTYNAKVTVVRKNGTSTSRVFKVVVK
jgi:hypothetical protein